MSGASESLKLGDLVLARWGDGSFQLAGWGLVGLVITFGTFGAFIRELFGRHR